VRNHQTEPPNSLSKRTWRRTVLQLGLLIGSLVILSRLVFAPVGPGLQKSKENAWMQQTRNLALSMFQYSLDHDGNYPDGKSSTEVFQKLLDEKYITYPGIFYIPLSGKTKAIQGQHLKPENVCFDVTCCVSSSSPDGLPIVFMTGYKVVYVPGGSAISLMKPFPRFGGESHTWLQWWREEYPKPEPKPGIAVCYKSNTVKFIPLAEVPNSDGSIPNFIPSTFDPAGKVYGQLTPDGLLSP